MTYARALALVVLAVLFGACREHPSEGPTAPDAPSAPAPTSAPEGAMCLEHGVLEAICTKHHPKLIPIFQAKGDWCAEHGFAESICPQCHPERGGRPAVAVDSAGDAPPDGTTIKFKSPDVAAKAGIEVAAAIAASRERGLNVSARLVYDGTRVAAVGPRMNGIVVRLAADVGSVVAVGTPLATLRSPDRDADRARLGPAQAKLRIMRTQLERNQKLAAEGLTSAQELLLAEGDVELAKADLGALQALLRAAGTDGAADGTWTITAPLAGVVTERHATAGNSVTAEQPLFTVVDASGLWAELDVPEDRLGEVKLGLRVTLTVDAFPDRTFEGVIDYLAPAIDPHTRTALVRVPLANPDGLLRANMFADATIAIAAAASQVEVPRAAVQRVGSHDLVFIAEAPGLYRTRRVAIADNDGKVVVIRDGLAAGERVVTTGSFLLKTEVLKDSIGAGCCEVD